MTERLSDLGEFGWIARLRERIPTSGRVVIGPGDDAAAVELRGGRRVLVTVDALVEDVHFRFGLCSPEDVGCKAIAASVSDIAAMGGIPRFALAAVGAPPETPVPVLDGILTGMRATAESFDVHLVGGDTVRSPQITLSVTIVGEEGDGGLVRRAGARAGDAVCVTGALGAAAAGLALLEGRERDPAARDLLERFPGLALAHRRGRARLREGQAAAARGVTAMLDLSDGLAGDLSRLCESSRCGVLISEQALPLAEGLEEAAAWMGSDARTVALHGGEDFELLMTVPAAKVDVLAADLRPTPLTRIGEIAPAGRTLVRASGESGELPGGGWDHFA